MNHIKTICHILTFSPWDFIDEKNPEKTKNTGEIDEAEDDWTSLDTLDWKILLDHSFPPDSMAD